MFKNFKIRIKLILAFAVVALVPALVAVIIIYTDISKTFLGIALSQESHDVEMKKMEIDSFLKGIKDEVLFLSNLSSINNLINFSNNEGDIEKLKKDLQNDFLSISRERKIYYQLRYIDENGQEVVRIDSDGQGNSFIVPKYKLQNKKDRYYFQDAIKANKGVVFVSPLDLNVEGGNIENRGTEENPEYVPVIRHATPVFDARGQAKGIVLANVYADYFLEGLREIHTGLLAGKQTILINSDGYFLYHDNPNFEWGFMLENDETVFKRCPDIVDIIFSKNKGQFFDKSSDCFVTYDRIYPSGDFALSNTGSSGDYKGSISKVQGKDYFWILYTRVERTEVLRQVNSLLYKFAGTSWISFILIFILAIFFERPITRPIAKLRDGVEIITKGNLSHRVNIDSKDEIGELAKSFNKMAAKLEKSRKDIQLEVKKRTEELEETNKYMIGRELKMIELKKKLKKED